MANLKEIKLKIGSVKNTQKNKAMKFVSSAKQLVQDSCLNKLEVMQLR